MKKNTGWLYRLHLAAMNNGLISLVIAATWPFPAKRKNTEDTNNAVSLERQMVERQKEK